MNKSSYNSPKRRRTPLDKIMGERKRIFGCFLTDLACKLRFGIRKLCTICGISESHTFRGKMMKGVEVDASIYQNMYVALKSVLTSRATLEYRFLLAQLEEGYRLFVAPVALGLLMETLTVPL